MKNPKSRIVFAMVVILGLGAALPGTAQKKFYTSSGFEMQFSWANISQDGAEVPSVMRWAPFFNLQSFFNYDFSERIGVFSGIGVRNVGFIYDESEGVRKKYRTYNAGIPFGIKVGNFQKTFAYAGYEMEFPIIYKEKTFVNEVKSKYNVWFSGRVPVIYNSILVGVQFPRGLNLKFKYYFTNFFNQDFTETDPDTGQQTQPYENLEVNILYISLGINLFKDKTVYFLEEY